MRGIRHGVGLAGWVFLCCRGKVRECCRASEESNCLAGFPDCLLDDLPPGIIGLWAQKDSKRGGNFSMRRYAANGLTHSAASRDLYCDHRNPVQGTAHTPLCSGRRTQVIDEEAGGSAPRARCPSSPRDRDVRSAIPLHLQPPPPVAVAALSRSVKKKGQVVDPVWQKRKQDC
ncbi:hypothetical protein NDU88_005524 [Pleurodeles waltl]|uniref:Uncharacterized protein n=1 Tax=Pleurodeles waltl TaxID=8319 RepID=A0AAV7SM21_PLEWA|nr:hypothetical protein NDU88_005524 [Pleurodeles waltl]